MTPSAVNSPEQAGQAPAPPSTLPFAWLVPVLSGAAVAFVLRLAFSQPAGHAFSAMLGAFIYLVPALCGAVTVYAAERIERRSWWYYLWAPWAATALFVLGTLVVYIEGMICAIVIAPLFGLLGAMGGLAMGIVCRITHWPRRALYSFAALPLVLGAVEPRMPNPDRLSSTTATVFIAAPPAAVWRQLNDAPDIQSSELGDAWAWRIGVPMPQAARSEQTAQGRVRHSHWRKNVHFDGLITEWQPDRRLAWRYQFKPDSFPAGVLDDHVMIGGHYFDLRETAYTLTPRAGGTELSINVSWRVSTRFNWYANAVAQWVLGDYSHHMLNFYKLRSERAAG